MAMLPVIWTDDEAESECKTYFNLYTFIVFLAWLVFVTIFLIILHIPEGASKDAQCPSLTLLLLLLLPIIIISTH